METYPFKNKPLPYDYDAIEPYIDAKTMELHHDRHLQTYIDNLNNTLKDYPNYHNWTLEQLIMYNSSLPEEIRTPVLRNAGGVYNHELYFENLTPAKTSQISSQANNMDRTMQTNSSVNTLVQHFGSMKSLVDAMTEAAMSIYGSGYAWLVMDAMGNPFITTLPNQATPLPMNLYPLLNLDMWEHAYYLKHYNKKNDYIKDWFNVVNWDNVEKRMRI